MRRRIARPAAAAGAITLAVLSATIVRFAPSTLADDCKVQIGGAEPAGQPWELTRLNLQSVWPISDGSGIRVGVVDSGLNTQQSQLSGMNVAPGYNVSGQFGPTDTLDCYFHGTAVAGIIAAPKVVGVYFTGVAPGATIVPIKEQSGEQQEGTNHIGAAIEAAIARNVQVINISITTSVPTPDLERAVADAARRDIVVVAAGGNDGATTDLPAYPAAYSTKYPNVLAVSMTDQKDQASGYSTRGGYINISAPGNGVELPMPKLGYRGGQSGTSYAAPVVAGTAALVRAAHPKLTAPEVVSRIEATADPPPGVSVPSTSYGYGIVNPYLAVTTVRDDAGPGLPTSKSSEIAALPPAPKADRHLQHLALATGLVLLGLAVIAGLIAGIIRRGSWFTGPAGRRAAPARTGR
jgi:type VII secretion-associated serine protease mycosin